MDDYNGNEERARVLQGLHIAVENKIEEVRQTVSKELQYSSVQQASAFEALLGEFKSGVEEVLAEIRYISHQNSAIYDYGQTDREHLRSAVLEALSAQTENLLTALKEHVDKRIGALGAALAERLEKRTEELGAAVTEKLEQRTEALTVALGEQLEQRTEALATQFGEQLEQRTEALSTQFGEQLEQRIEALSAQFGEELQKHIEALGAKFDEQLEQRTEALATSITERLNKSSAETQAAVAEYVDERIGEAEKAFGEQIVEPDQALEFDYDRLAEMIAEKLDVQPEEEAKQTEEVPEAAEAEPAEETEEKKEETEKAEAVAAEQIAEPAPEPEPEPEPEAVSEPEPEPEPEKVPEPEPVRTVRISFDEEDFAYDVLAEKIASILPEVDYDLIADKVLSALPQTDEQLIADRVVASIPPTDEQAIADRVADTLPPTDYDYIAEKVASVLEETAVNLTDDTVERIAVRVVELLRADENDIESIVQEAAPVEETEKPAEKPAETQAEEIAAAVAERVKAELASEKMKVVPEKKTPPVTEVEDESKMVRYKRSFIAKIIESDEDIKEYYSTLKNAILEYGKVRSQINWTNDRFTLENESIVKIGVRGKTLCLYVALDPAEFPESVYHQKFAGDTKMYEKTPMMIKIKSNVAVKRGIRLIELLMERNGAVKEPREKVDYAAQYFFRTEEELLAEGLIKTAVVDKSDLDF